MSFDREINYRVNIDDSGFQAKLSNLRASLDSTIGGGMGGAQLGALLAPQSQNTMMLGGLADFGSQIRPVTYTPPAIAMQPHFGMFAINQSAAASFAGAFGPTGANLYYAREPIGGAIGGAALGAMFAGPLGALGGAIAGGAVGISRTDFTKDIIPLQVSMAEHMELSARSTGTRMGDLAGSIGLAAASTGVGLLSAGFGDMIGTHLGGKLGGFAGGAIGGMIPAKYAAEVYDMMANNRAVQSALESGSFRFITGGKDLDTLTGRGFSRDSRMKVANFIQQTELKDLRFGPGEMRQVLEAGMQYDMFSGTGDVEGFKTKFKGLVEGLKTITSALHTSLKEGIEVMRGFRDMGVDDVSTMTRLSLQSEAFGRASGKTGSEMLAVGQAGAEIFRGTGVRMGLGFDLNQMNTVLIRSGLNQGTLSRETVAQAGGENALAQQMTANALSFTQTAFGRGLLLGQYKTGLTNEQIGRGDVFSLFSPLAGTTAGELVHFQANQEELIGKMGPLGLKNLESSGMMAQATTLARSGMGIGFRDAFISLQLQNGKSRSAIDATLSSLEGDPDKIRTDIEKAAFGNVARQTAMEEARSKYNFGKKLSNFARTALGIDFASRFFMNVSNTIGNEIDDMGGYFSGSSVIRTNAGLTEAAVKSGKDLVEAAGSKADQEAYLVQQGFGVSDASGNLIQRTVGGQSGEALAERFVKGNMSFGGMTAQAFKTQEDVERAAQTSRQRYTILTRTSDAKGGGIVAVRTSDLEGHLKRIRDEAPEQKDIEKAKEMKLTEAQEVALAKLVRGGAENVTGAQIAKALGFKETDYGKLSGVERAQIGIAAEQYGFSGAKNETDVSIAGDALLKSAQGDSNTGRKKFEDVSLRLRGALSRGGASTDALELVADGRGGAKGSAELRRALMHLSETAGTKDGDKALSEALKLAQKEGIDQKSVLEIEASAKKLGIRDRMTLRDTMKDMDVGAFVTSQAKSTAVGANVGADVAGLSASIDATTLKNLKAIADATEQQLKQLLELAKQFKDLDKRYQGAKNMGKGG